MPAERSLPSGDLGALRRVWSDCRRCPLYETRRSLVFGSGCPTARIMLVGGAPGEVDDDTGAPFVGPWGNMLGQLFSGAGVKRSDLYITHTVCCRPPDNRKPNLLEQKACRPRLLEQICTVDPDIILAAGPEAAKLLLGTRSFSITSDRGVPRSSVMEGREISYSTTIVPILHPEYLLRNPGMQKHGPIYKTVQDLYNAQQTVERLWKLRSQNGQGTTDR